MWNWQPNRTLGEIILGGNADTYIEQFNLVKDVTNDDNTGWVRYNFPGQELFVDIEDNKVVSVLSYDEFFYNTTNLIGLNIKELELLLGKKADETGESVMFDDNDIQVPYDFFEFGLQVWVSGNKIVSASCVNYDE